MKTLTELFPRISLDKIEQELEKSAIRIDETFGFSNINIVIGSNGSGKTRFLKCIRSLYELEGQTSILYGYLPALSDHKMNEVVTVLPEYSLVDTFSDDDATFEDLFKAIEADCEGFILELLEYKSKKQKERGEAAWKKIQAFFECLSEKRLIKEENGLFVLHNMNSEKTSLQMALNSFSPGELMLFYMSIFLMLKENGKKRKAIILDEPESHLHPKALIAFIQALTKVHSDTEIWLATHSLFLLPEFEFENIVYINSSEIPKRNGSMYQKVLSSVLGDNDKTSQFLSSLSQWQYCEYLAECFTNPTIVDSINPNDEQVLLFRKYLEEHRILKILDFGGGSARLGKSLKAAGADMQYRFRYEILDKDPQYKGSEYKVYRDFSELKRANYDCIVMMNVLHEISPDEWPGIFKKLSSHMKEDANIVFVETSRLSKGEMPNDIGYLVLSEKDLRILFNSPVPLTQLKIPESKKSFCVLLPKSCLSNITVDTVQKAITHLKNRSWSEIKKCRDSNVNTQDLLNARCYAYWTQMYINAELYIEKISNKRKSITSKSISNPSDSLLQLSNLCNTIGNLSDIGNLPDISNLSTIGNLSDISNLSTISNFSDIGKDISSLFTLSDEVVSSMRPRKKND